MNNVLFFVVVDFYTVSPEKLLLERLHGISVSEQRRFKHPLSDERSEEFGC